ncbi:MAG: tetratricopeptide repeat protein, partial [Phormidesmis sp.]
MNSIPLTFGQVRLSTAAALILIASVALPIRPATAAQVTPSVQITQADSTEAIIEQGQQQLDRGEYAAALALFDQAIEQSPDAARAWVGKGEALYGLTQFEAAVTALRQATALAPDSLYAWVWLGNAYDDNGQLDLSLAAYASALEIDQTHPMPYYHRGIALWYAGRYEEAVTDFQLVTEIAPEFSTAWMWLGRSLEPQAEYGPALSAFEQALALEPTSTDAVFG